MSRNIELHAGLKLPKFDVSQPFFVRVVELCQPRPGQENIEFSVYFIVRTMQASVIQALWKPDTLGKERIHPLSPLSRANNNWTG